MTHKSNMSNEEAQNLPIRHLGRWLEACVDLIQEAGEAVEGVLQKLFVPIGEEVKKLGQDLRAADSEIRAWYGKQSSGKAAGNINFGTFKEIFVGSERQEQLKTLNDNSAPLTSPAEQAANKQLLAGGATVAVNILGIFYNPAFFFLGAAGLVYYSAHVFRKAYHALTQKRQIDIYVFDAITISAAFLSGSLVAVTVGIFSACLLEWIVVKTESIAQRSISSVFSKQPRFVWVRAQEGEIQVAFDQLHTDDTIVVGAGDMIPVDGIIVVGMASVDQRMMTGESQGVDKGPGDSVLASTFVLSGRIDIKVVRSGDATVAAQVAQVLQDTSRYKKELRARAEDQLDHLAIPYLSLAALTVPLWGINSAAGVLRSIPAYRMMFFGPLTMLSFMHVASQKGILLKNGRALERLLEVDTIVFDKTGTLTLEQPTVGQIFCFADLTAEKVTSVEKLRTFVRIPCQGVRTNYRQTTRSFPLGEVSESVEGKREGVRRQMVAKSP